MVHPPVTKPVTPLWDTLAATRFCLAMIIVADHIRVSGFANPLTTAVASCSAYIAILCFLMISGFSIAHSIGKQQTGFYRRRLVRLYPLYFLAVVLPMVFNTTGTPVSARDVAPTLQNLVFLQSITTFQTRFNPVTWTLGVEAACYLMAPWLARRRTSILVLLAAASAGAFLYAAAAHVVYPSYNLAGEPLLVTAWAWIAGYIYYRYHRHMGSAFILGGAVVAVLWISGLPFGRFYLLPCGLTISAFAFGRFLRIARPIRACLSFSGDVSYPLYLFQLPTLNVMTHRLGSRSNLVLVVAAVSVAIFFALLDIALKRFRRRPSRESEPSVIERSQVGTSG